MLENTNKIIVVLGPTSSGKTKLGVCLARKFNGEIVSADSRQVYQGMDIGTGKDLCEYKIKKSAGKSKAGEKMKIIPYHLIDVVRPEVKFSLAQYQKLAFRAIEDILRRGKMPIIVGGTGLYLQALVDNYVLSAARPDRKLRTELEKKSAAEVYQILKGINSKFSERLNVSEKKNKRRLIRYLEVCQTKNVKPSSGNLASKNYSFLLIGLNWKRKILNKRIYERLIKRLEKEDMTGEVKKLRKAGVSWKRLESFGLEYKFISLYLQEKLNYEAMVEKLFIASRQFAKRQMTWFKRWERQGRKIHWIKDQKEAEKLAEKFLN